MIRGTVIRNYLRQDRFYNVLFLCLLNRRELTSFALSSDIDEKDDDFCGV